MLNEVPCIKGWIASNPGCEVQPCVLRCGLIQKALGWCGRFDAPSDDRHCTRNLPATAVKRCLDPEARTTGRRVVAAAYLRATISGEIPMTCKITLSLLLGVVLLPLSALRTERRGLQEPSLSRAAQSDDRCGGGSGGERVESAHVGDRGQQGRDRLCHRLLRDEIVAPSGQAAA